MLLGALVLSFRRMNVAFFDSKSYDRESFAEVELEGSETIEWKFHEARLSASTAVLASDCKAICVFVNDTIDREVIESLAEEGVKLIALRCAGFNNVDLEAAEENGLTVVRVPAYSPHAVAEHAIALLLTLNRKVHRAWNRVREHNFSLHHLVGFDLHGKTAGVIGTGKIGRETAKIFRGFGMRVLAQDAYPDETWATENGVEYVGLEALLPACDVVSLHVPLIKETSHLMNAERFNQMKDSAILINTSRGKLVDTKALIQALKSKSIGGVALDVYEEEEGLFFEDKSDDILPDDQLARLLTFPNVLITSHQAFLTKEALHEIARVTTVNLLHLDREEAMEEGTRVEVS